MVMKKQMVDSHNAYQMSELDDNSPNFVIEEDEKEDEVSRAVSGSVSSKQR